MQFGRVVRGTFHCAGLTAFFVCSLWASRAAARHFYDEFWPGHPDSFRFDTALLPRASFTHWGDPFWTDSEQALIFICSCGVFALPPLLAACASRSRVQLGLALCLTGLNLIVATWTIWNRYDSYYAVFLPRDHTFVNVIAHAWKDFAWVAGLSAAGLLLGGAVAWRYLPRIRTHCCTSCGYDVRVQLKLGLPRCPECGASLSGAMPMDGSMSPP